MSALTKFEGFVENLLEGSLTRLMRGQLQPVEIAKRLAREMENSKAISVGRVFVANEYFVYLSLRDYQRVDSVRATMERELAEYLVGVARERRLTLISKPSVSLFVGESLPPRQMRVEARLIEQAPFKEETAPPSPEKAPPVDFGQTRRFDTNQLKRAVSGPSFVSITPQYSLVVTSGLATGTRYSIDKPAVGIGRGLGNDIVVDDARVSRQHAEIRFIGGRYSIYDLKSTNGTWVNGKRINESLLQPGDVISLGGKEFSFELEAKV